MRNFRTSRGFLIWFFNNIMEIGAEELNWTVKERVKEMRELIEIYRRDFRLWAYSDVQVWRRIKKLYWRDWDALHWEMLELEKRRYGKKN